MGAGFSKHELAIYNVWWREFEKGWGHSEPTAKPGEVSWYGIVIQEEKLLKWVREKLKSVDSEKVAARHIRRLQIEFLVPDKVLRGILRDCLDLAEEYVKRWWRLLDFHAVGFQMLIEELQKSMWEPADLAKPLFRSAARNRPRQLRAAVEGVKTGRLGDWIEAMMLQDLSKGGSEGGETAADTNSKTIEPLMNKSQKKNRQRRIRKQKQQSIIKAMKQEQADTTVLQFKAQAWTTKAFARAELAPDLLTRKFKRLVQECSGVRIEKQMFDKWTNRNLAVGDIRFTKEQRRCYFVVFLLWMGIDTIYQRRCYLMTRTSC
jgi:hypothetical protein